MRPRRITRKATLLTDNQFGAYEAAKKTLAEFEGHGDTQKINKWSKFAAGGLAGMAAQYVGWPPRFGRLSG